MLMKTITIPKKNRFTWHKGRGSYAILRHTTYYGMTLGIFFASMGGGVVEIVSISCGGSPEDFQIQLFRDG